MPASAWPGIEHDEVDAGLGDGELELDRLAGGGDDGDAVTDRDVVLEGAVVDQHALVVAGFGHDRRRA